MMNICTCKNNAWDYYCSEHGGESGQWIKTVFVETFNAVAAEAHQIATDKGFTDGGDVQLIAQGHRELSEAFEAMRHNNPPDDKVPEFSAVEVEFADLFIRIMETGNVREWRLAEAILAKLEYNKSRPYKHGKEF